MGILDKKSQFVEFIMTEIGRRNLSKNFENFAYFSVSDSPAHYSSSNYQNMIVNAPPSSMPLDRISLSDVKWSNDPASLNNRFSIDSLYDIDSDTTLYNFSDEHKYLPNVTKAPDLELSDSDLESEVEHFGPYLGRMALDANNLIRTNYKNNILYLDGPSVFDENMADGDPTVSIGENNEFIDPYAIEILKFQQTFEGIDLDNKPTLLADKFTEHLINYAFLPPQVVQDDNTVSDLFTKDDQSFIVDIRGLPRTKQGLKEHFDQSINEFFLRAGDNILGYSMPNSAGRNKWLKIDIFEVTYSDQTERRKILPLDVIKISDQFWLVGKFSVEVNVGGAEQKDLSEKKFFPIFGILFEVKQPE